MALCQGAFILSRLGQCLLYFTNDACSSRGFPKPSSFCHLIATMMDCSGSPLAAYVELHGWGVVLCSGFRVIVAVLCDASRPSIAGARIVAAQILNAFLKLHHAHVLSLDDELAQKIDDSLKTYTFESVTHVSQNEVDAAPSGVGSYALETFQPFLGTVLRPLLSLKHPTQLWLLPLLEHRCVLRAWIINPSPLPTQEEVLLESPSKPDRNLAMYTGPHAPAVWAELLHHSKTVTQLHATVTEEPNTIAHTIHTYAFASLCDGDECLHFIVLPARLIPAGACIVVFFQAQLPSSAREDGTQTGSAVRPLQAKQLSGGAPSQSESTTQLELRRALERVASSIAASFPMSVAELHRTFSGGQSPPPSIQSSTPVSHSVMGGDCTESMQPKSTKCECAANVRSESGKVVASLPIVQSKTKESSPVAHLAPFTHASTQQALGLTKGKGAYESKERRTKWCSRASVKLPKVLSWFSRRP